MKIQKRIIENHAPKSDPLLEALKSLKPDQELVTSSAAEAVDIRSRAASIQRMHGITIRTKVRGGNLVAWVVAKK